MTTVPKRLFAPLLVLALMAFALPAMAQTTTTSTSTTTTVAPTTTSTTSTSTTTPTPPDPTTAVLPLLGAPVTIIISFDAAGTLQQVSVDPTSGFTPVPPDPSAPAEEHGDEVTFTFTNGEVQLKIEAEEGELETKVKAATIDALTGPGAWSADVFGTGLAFVDYTIGTDADGNPTVSVDGVTVPDGMTYELRGVTVDHDGERAEMRVRFFLDGAERTFKIRVQLDDDGQVGAKLKLTLSDFEADDDHGDDSADEADDDHGDDDGQVGAKLKLTLSDFEADDDHGDDSADEADDDHGDDSADEADDDHGDDGDDGNGDDGNGDDGNGDDGNGDDGNGDDHGDDGDDD